VTQPGTTSTTEGRSVDHGSNGPPGGWLRHRLRIEDALLFTWLVLVLPLLEPAAGASASGAADRVTGLLGLVALLSFVACLAARSQTGVVSGLVDRGDLRYAVGPLFAAFAFALDETGRNLGLEGNLGLVPIAAAIAVAILVRRFAPPLSTMQRRLLVVPFIIVTSRFFEEVLSGLADIFDLRELASAVAGPAEFARIAFLVPVAVAAILIFYVMLVFGPRQVADREGSPRTWTVRFAVFMLGLILGQTFGDFLGPG